MKDLKTFLFESKCKVIPNNNPYFTDGTASEDLVHNSFQGDAETRWSEIHKGEIIEYTTEYFKQCVKNKTKLTNFSGKEKEVYTFLKEEFPSFDFKWKDHLNKEIFIHPTNKSIYLECDILAFKENSMIAGVEYNGSY